ncbi:MAG TPA: DUF2891 domain-containing protein [Caulobacteraceae bacterium]|nr:DUF2891 domain-containing protein [Caulobacteraceae bacterium]
MIELQTAGRLARAALGHVGREYPNSLQHVLTDAADARTPRELHPIFYGSYDWHSCVHGHWLLASLLRLQPELAEADAIRAHFGAGYTQSAVEGELAYLDRPSARGFERPYGWAWLLKLEAELVAHDADWSRTMRPLAGAFVDRFTAFLPKADYPLRAGVHSNTAFALALCLDYARASGNGVFEGVVTDKARAWYGADAGCQAWEPSGDEFLSPALMEAELMRRILPPPEFGLWFARFLPEAGEGRPASLFTPAAVSDRSDGKIAHLDGLNLSRAWCWRGIASSLKDGDPVKARALSAAQTHLAASLPYVTGDYMGEHWLASFALLALMDPAPGGSP